VARGTGTRADQIDLIHILVARERLSTLLITAVPLTFE
jgi:hypothetical protein